MSIRRALGISGATQVASFLLNLASVIVVSRLLSPEEIGIFSVSVTLLGLAHMLRDFGVGQFLIQATQLTRDHLRAAFTVALITAWTAAALILLLRYPAAAFYHREGVAEVLGLISLNFIIMPFGTPILSLLRREMLFGKLAIVSLASTSVQVAATIIAALSGLSYMSMAWGSLAGMIANVAVLLLLNPKETFQLPTLKGLREVFQYGSKVSVTAVVVELGGSAPDLIFGRTLGFSAVAYSSRAAGLVNMATGQLNSLVQGVFLPAFAKEVRSRGNLSATYARVVEHMTGVTMPLLAFSALIATPLIDFMFGPQWERSGPLASLICVYAFLFSPFVLANQALIATGQMNAVMKVQLVVKGLSILLLLTSVFLSLEQVIMLLWLPTIVSCWLNMSAMHSAFGLRFSILRAHLKTSCALVPLALIGPTCLLALDQALAWSLSPLAILATTALLFSTSWLAAVFAVRHPLRHEVARLVRTVLGAIRK